MGCLHLQLPDWWRCTPQLRHLLRIVAHALTKLHFFLPVKYIVAAVVVPVLFAPSPGGSLHALFRTVSNIIKDGLHDILGQLRCWLLCQVGCFLTRFTAAPHRLWLTLSVIIVWVAERMLDIANSLDLPITRDVRVPKNVTARATSSSLLLNFAASHDATEPSRTGITFLAWHKVTHRHNEDLVIVLGFRQRWQDFAIQLSLFRFLCNDFCPFQGIPSSRGCCSDAPFI
mmetsp:Transcript_98713/g.235189  ORF Transcript_98713/g.235189 Transcript_98713/m.235189 type:complete len:229 (-) Transcript_98713:1809-2495(-)